MRVPETSLLAAVLMLEIGFWCVALVTSMPYCFCCVGPAELWDRTDGFFGYVFAFLMEGVHQPAIRRQMYFYSAMVYLIGGGPYLLFKVTPHTAWDDYACACTMRVLCVYATPHASPLLLFKVPLLGPALFGLRRATGYDRQGNVRVLMTAEESEHRYKHEQRAVSKRAGHR